MHIPAPSDTDHLWGASIRVLQSQPGLFIGGCDQVPALLAVGEHNSDHNGKHTVFEAVCYQIEAQPESQ